MHSATKLAFGILLLYLAGVLLFVAFHPGGLKLSDGQPAGNPVDVFKYMLGNRDVLGDLGKQVNYGADGTVKHGNIPNADPNGSKPS